jgi:hypothetical protein
LYEQIVEDQYSDGSWSQLFVRTANNLWNLALLARAEVIKAVYILAKPAVKDMISGHCFSLLQLSARAVKAAFPLVTFLNFMKHDRLNFFC